MDGLPVTRARTKADPLAKGVRDTKEPFIRLGIVDDASHVDRDEWA